MSVSGFEVEPLALSGAALIRLPRFGDSRGTFSVLANQELFAALGMGVGDQQQNLSRSARAGTVRGLHCQAPPHAQAKLVTVLQGSILDVLVDARSDSPTFGQYRAVVLDADNRRALFVPRGYLHGFVTRTNDTMVHYTVDNAYAPEADLSIAWNDPDLAIDWQFDPDTVTLSDKDAAGRPWTAIGDMFRGEPNGLASSGGAS